MNSRDIEKETFLYNGNPLPASEFDPSKATKYPSVYEVIRVIGGVPLFWESHFDRLQKSIAMAGSSYRCCREDLYQQMKWLIRENRVHDYNLKIILNDFSNNSTPHIYLLFITTRYPTNEELSQGVPVITHLAERSNPNAKIIAVDFRVPILNVLQQSGAYEALLVNHRGEITEGSRSNFFVIKDAVFYTPPADRILEGITRQVVIRLLERLGYPLITAPMTINFIRESDGLFLTGTSPGILPVNRVDDHPLNIDLKPLQDLQRLFHHFIQTYLSVHREE
ncbi:MAG: aminotransferase class IV [Bacillota bacterium]|nr:aminotransferase class IV [Bacillota bacterium]MDW7678085.1 aminotransferase class IV [Bacillota bacterium]